MVKESYYNGMRYVNKFLGLFITMGTGFAHYWSIRLLFLKNVIYHCVSKIAVSKASAAYLGTLFLRLILITILVIYTFRMCI